MKILISGCSFTQWPDAPGGPNICWPRYFQEYNADWQCRSVAEAAAGNQYICDSIIRGVISDRPDRVIVMWSGVSRLDYLTSLEDEAWEKLYNSYGFFRRLPNNKLGYIFSGGGTGTWFNHPVSKRMFEEMYKVSSELSLGTINLMEMIKLQNFLIAKKIPYHFMSYVNYWSHEERVSPNGDFGVYQYPELKELINELDFSRWIFLNEQRDGVYELSKQLNSWQDDGFHPGAEAQSQWAQLITDRVKQDL
jgi:hypothetical protein